MIGTIYINNTHLTIPLSDHWTKAILRERYYWLDTLRTSQKDGTYHYTDLSACQSFYFIAYG